MWTAVFTIAVCAVLAVVGLVAGGVVPVESLPVPAGVLEAFQVNAPGIAVSEDMDENLSQKEKSVVDVRASHASKSREEEGGRDEGDEGDERDEGDEGDEGDERDERDEGDEGEIEASRG